MPRDQEDLLLLLLREGSRSQAIQLYREETGAGADDAREVVAQLRAGCPKRCSEGARGGIGSQRHREVAVGPLIEELGRHLHARLSELVGHGVLDVHGRGQWAGVDNDPSLISGRAASEAMLAEGILGKDTHGSTIRFAPPIVVTTEELDLAVDALARVLAAAG